jgi:hypothetical protein
LSNLGVGGRHGKGTEVVIFKPSAELLVLGASGIQEVMIEMIEIIGLFGTWFEAAGA